MTAFLKDIANPGFKVYSAVCTVQTEMMNPGGGFEPRFIGNHFIRVIFSMSMPDALLFILFI